MSGSMTRIHERMPSKPVVISVITPRGTRHQRDQFGKFPEPSHSNSNQDLIGHQSEEHENIEIENDIIIDTKDGITSDTPLVEIVNENETENGETFLYNENIDESIDENIDITTLKNANEALIEGNEEEDEDLNEKFEEYQRKSKHAYMDTNEKLDEQSIKTEVQIAEQENEIISVNMNQT